MQTPNSRFSNYEEFWLFYLKEHSQHSTKLWHGAGTVLATIMGISALFFGKTLLLIAAIFTGYAFAWFSHFYIEKNRPATFKYPLWSFLSDLRMFYWLILGKFKT